MSKYQSQDIFSEKAFNESLFIASPEFYEEKIKSFHQGEISPKMKQSLNKYLTRASTRCTPFGLFAGCSVGKLDETTELTLDQFENYRRVTRLDMNYMCALIQNIEQHKEIRTQLRYFPNDSIYQLGGAYRYVEYYYTGVRRVHRITSVEPTDYLTLILEAAKQGKYCSELAILLVSDEITQEEAHEFIEELIDAQMLKSELEITVTGNNSLIRLINQLKSLSDTEQLTSLLSEINELLSQIDRCSFGESLPLYTLIIEKITALGIKFEPKFLFQTDVFKPSTKATLSQGVVDEFESLLTFLNKATSKPEYTNLSAFCNTFYERYEDLEVPLLEALDTELGIGYQKGDDADTPNELIAGVVYRKAIPGNGQSEGNSSRLQNVMLRKYMECIKSGSNRIELTDDDVAAYKDHWKDTPNTMCIMCSILDNKEIHIKSIGGSSAANLLGRFCHLDPTIEALSKEIAAKDQELSSDAILAEIVHLPESRIGNILFRPVLREYEIHYLANTEVADEYSIPLSDLYLSVRGNRIMMRSKRLNKEIIPRLTTAHNYSYNALPVYQFLCEMQTQHLRSGLYVGWDSVFNSFEYRPRLVYKNFILSREQWFIDSDKIKDINAAKLKEHLQTLRVPRYVLIPDGDNEQFIDFEHEGLVDLFLSILKKRKKVWVEEFLFKPNDTLVHDANGASFCNEFLFSFYKNNQE